MRVKFIWPIILIRSLVPSHLSEIKVERFVALGGTDSHIFNQVTVAKHFAIFMIRHAFISSTV